MCRLSVIIPVFNAEGLLENSLERISKFLNDFGIDHEIIVCDDRSSDRSAQIMRALEPRFKTLRCFYNENNKGLGFVLRRMAAAARGEMVVYTDIDLPFGEKVIGVLYDEAHRSDVVIASRYIRPNDIPLLRRLCSESYYLLCRIMFGIKVRDIGSGGVAWRRKKDILSLTSADGFGIHVEMLHMALSQGLHVKEIAYQPDRYKQGSFSVRKHTIPVLRETWQVWKRRARQMR